MMNKIKLIGLIKEVIAEQQLKEANTATQILQATKKAIADGSEVTVMGKPISKVVIPAGAFLPSDGSTSIRISNLENPLEDILIDGESITITQPAPTPRRTSSSEEIAAAEKAFQDRFGPGGGVQTFFGKRTGD